MLRNLIGRLAALCLVAFCLQAVGAPVVVGIADMCMETNCVSILPTYAAAFARAGNTPFVLPAETNRAVVARMLASVDVLLLCGGEDVSQAATRRSRHRFWERSTCGATPGSSCCWTRR